MNISFVFLVMSVNCFSHPLYRQIMSLLIKKLVTKLFRGSIKAFSKGDTKHDMRLIRRKLIRKPRYLPITATQVQKKLNEYNGK